MTKRRAGWRASLVAVCLVLAWLAAGVPSAAGVAGVALVTHGSRDRPRIALTFDDGVSPENCRRILAILVGDNVPATFFPTAEAMLLDPAFWGLVVRAGDPVGDHTLTHPQMPTLSSADQLHQITAGRSLGESILGRSMLRVFRPPYGHYDTRTLAAAGKAGFKTVLMWDVAIQDTSRHRTLAELLAAGERGTNGSVILMHCGPNATPYLLQPLIDHYRARGFQFVTVAGLLGVPWTTDVTTPPSTTEILDGLSPLPDSPSGGPVTGLNGYVLPVATSTPLPSSGPPSTLSPTPSPAPPSDSSTPGNSDPPDRPSNPDDAGSGRALVAALLAIAAGAGGLTLIVRRRRVGRART